MGINIAVVGATGNVGREILTTLDERDIPIDTAYAVASTKSIGKEVSFGEDKILKVDSLEGFDFSKVDYVLSSAGAQTARTFVPLATAAGAIVIDNSSAFRNDPTVPLIVPEVNGHLIEETPETKIFSNPNCVAIPLALVLHALGQLSPLQRIVVSTYQSVSGAGHKAMDELFRQTRDIFMNTPITREAFQKQIAFNVIPHIGDFEENGFTGEENKVMTETQKVLGSGVPIVATCVRVPVFVSHSLSVTVAFDTPVDIQEARDHLRECPGIAVIDHRTDEGYVTPAEAANEQSVFVSRIRDDPTVPHGLCLWIVADNLRKGAALNTVQILERLCGIVPDEDLRD